MVDGDTLDIAQGDIELRVRLIGINTPEHDECWFDEATAAMTDLVGDGPVWLVRDETDLDQYGRALRYVIDAAGDDVGAALVDRGDAMARRYPPNTSRDDEYALRQEAARAEDRGLWAPDACGPLSTEGVLGAPTAVSIDIDIHPDADGHDNENLNDEWVRFTNTGPAAIDLAGWTVKDESSSHRYHIDDLVLEPGESVTLFTGCGVDTDVARYWCEVGSAVWNNGGDTVYLLDPAGNVVTYLPY